MYDQNPAYCLHNENLDLIFFANSNMLKKIVVG